MLAVREAPLSSIHLENMLTLARMGAMVMPPCLRCTTIPARSTTSSTTPSPGCSISSARRSRRRALGGGDGSGHGLARLRLRPASVEGGAPAR